MSTSGPEADKADALDDDDDAATVAADERNDNEAARDAAATALWTRCLEHAGRSPRWGWRWPGYLPEGPVRPSAAPRLRGTPS